MPAKVRKAYVAEDSEYKRYSKHTESLVQQGIQQGKQRGTVETLMTLIQTGKVTLDDIMQSQEYGIDIKSEVSKLLLKEEMCKEGNKKT